MTSKYFDIRELVPPDVYEEYGSKAWDLLDPRAPQMIDSVREHFGPIVINNWHTGGQYKESGYRRMSSKTGAKFSQHKYGRAFDLKPSRLTPQDMYREILASPALFPLITTIENIAYTPTWVHIDQRPSKEGGIRIVNP